MNNIHPYSPELFDEGYYGKRSRSGFGDEINWDNPIQQSELQKKFDSVNTSGDYETILFIGCALGNEVRYFRDKNKSAFGVEVSEYAVNNCDKSVKEFVKLYNGWELNYYHDSSIDVIASFDVMTLIPDDMLKKLIKEICRVSKDRVIIRTIIDPDGERKGKWIGNDGVTFRYLTLKGWSDLFIKEDYRLMEARIDYKYEATIIFRKKRIKE